MAELACCGHSGSINLYSCLYDPRILLSSIRFVLLPANESFITNLSVIVGFQRISYSYWIPGWILYKLRNSIRIVSLTKHIHVEAPSLSIARQSLVSQIELFRYSKHNKNAKRFNESQILWLHEGIKFKFRDSLPVSRQPPRSARKGAQISWYPGSLEKSLTASWTDLMVTKNLLPATDLLDTFVLGKVQQHILKF